MARLPLLHDSDLPPHQRDILARKLNLYRVLAHSPDTARAFAAFGMHLRHHATLNPRLRELAILQVGLATQASYEFAHHVELGRQYGVSADDIEALRVESRGEVSDLPALERAVLRAARELVAGSAVSDATYVELAAGFASEHLVDLIVTIAFYCAVVRVLGAFEIELETGYEDHLDAMQ